MPIVAAVFGMGRGNVKVYSDNKKAERDAYDNIKTKAHLQIAHLQMHDDND